MTESLPSTTNSNGEFSTNQRRNWQVYIIVCSDNSLYTGITTDIDRRFQMHARGSGARYFRGRQPLQVVYLEKNHSRSSASSRETAIKNLNRSEKMTLIARCHCDADEFLLKPVNTQELLGETEQFRKL